MGTGKKKIEIKKKEKESDRMVTFSKRRKGLFKKAEELHKKTGANIAAVVFSPAGRPYTTGHPSFDATIDNYLMMNSTVQEKNNDGDLGRSWLESLQVESYDNVEELFGLKKDLEEIREKVLNRIHYEEFFNNL